jgi:tRNA (cmo5U34)-methyltransferase
METASAGGDTIGGQEGGHGASTVAGVAAGDVGDFDARPPMPVAEYEQTVRRVNMGYDLLFTLTHCFLRALRRPNLDLLVVGAGGGAEIERFLPDNPGWRLTGVDPSQDMLALAQAKAESLGVISQVTLVKGTVEELPPHTRFDAATCLFVLHFLPDAGKRTLLQGIAERLRPEAPVLVASGCRVNDGGLGEDFLGAWQHYGELLGMPAEQMAKTISGLMAQQPDLTSEDDHGRLLVDAGFTRVASYFRVMGGGMGAWIAR